jgi:hypothetical protein
MSKTGPDWRPGKWFLADLHRQRRSRGKCERGKLRNGEFVRPVSRSANDPERDGFRRGRKSFPEVRAGARSGREQEPLARIPLAALSKRRHPPQTFPPPCQAIRPTPTTPLRCCKATRALSYPSKPIPAPQFLLPRKALPGPRPPAGHRYFPDEKLRKGSKGTGKIAGVAGIRSIPHPSSALQKLPPGRSGRNDTLGATERVRGAREMRHGRRACEAWMAFGQQGWPGASRDGCASMECRAKTGKCYEERLAAMEPPLLRRGFPR